MRDDQGQALAGQTVNLLWMGMPYGSQPTTTNGSYSFSGLSGGSYTVSVAPAPPATYNPPNPRTVQLAVGEQRQLDFTLQVLGGGNPPGNEYLAVVWHHDWGPQWPGSHKVAVGGGNTQVAGDRNPPDYGMFLYFVVSDPGQYFGITPQRLTILRSRDGAVMVDSPSYSFAEAQPQTHPGLPGLLGNSRLWRSHGMLDGPSYTNGDYLIILTYTVLFYTFPIPTAIQKMQMLTVTIRNPILEPVSPAPLVLWNPKQPNQPGPTERTMTESVHAIQKRPVRVDFSVHHDNATVNGDPSVVAQNSVAIAQTSDDWSNPVPAEWIRDGQQNGQPAPGAAYPWDATLETNQGLPYRLDRRASDPLRVLAAEDPPQQPVTQAEYLGHDPAGAGGAGSQRFRLRYRLRATADPRQASGGVIRLYKPDLSAWEQALTTEQLAASADGTVYDWTIEVPVAEMTQHGWYRFMVLVQDAHQEREVAQRVKWALPAGVEFATVGVPVRVMILHQKRYVDANNTEIKQVIEVADAWSHVAAAKEYWQQHLVYLLDALGGDLSQADLELVPNPAGVELHGDGQYQGEWTGSFDDSASIANRNARSLEELALLGSTLRSEDVVNVFYVNKFASGGTRGVTYAPETSIVMAGFWHPHNKNLELILTHELGHLALKPAEGLHTALWDGVAWNHMDGDPVGEPVYGLGVDTDAEYEQNLMRDMANTNPFLELLTIEQVRAYHFHMQAEFPGVQP